jgi:hypothetical protein
LFALYLLFPAVLLPLALPPALGLAGSFLLGVGRDILNLLGSGVLLIAAFVGYRFSLNQAGAYLQSREQRILETLTTPVE